MNNDDLNLHGVTKSLLHVTREQEIKIQNITKIQFMTFKSKTYEVFYVCIDTTSILTCCTTENISCLVRPRLQGVTSFAWSRHRIRTVCGHIHFHPFFHVWLLLNSVILYINLKAILILKPFDLISRPYGSGMVLTGSNTLEYLLLYQLEYSKTPCITEPTFLKLA